LCRDHFPGLVHIGGRYEPAWTWEHYAHAPDQLDRDGRCFDNKAERVKAELWVSISRNTLLNTANSFDIFSKNYWIYRGYMQDFYMCDEGYEESAPVTSHNRCIKLVKDMHYEAQVQCVINYGAMFLKQKIKKEVARNMKLTREQYLQVHLQLYLY